MVWVHSKNHLVYGVFLTLPNIFPQSLEFSLQCLSLRPKIT